MLHLIDSLSGVPARRCLGGLKRRFETREAELCNTSSGRRLTAALGALCFYDYCGRIETGAML